MNHAPAPIGAPNDPPRRADGRPARWAICLACSSRFAARVDKATAYCSRRCFHGHACRRMATVLQERFIHQSDDAAKKVRANGLINKRLKLGLIERPACCERCGRKGKVDACHVDYDLPDVVAFACRSCHMRSHYDPAIEAELKILARSRGGPVLQSLSHIRGSEVA